MSPTLALTLALVGVAQADWEPAEAAAEDFNAGVLALDAADPEGAEAAFRATLKTDPSCGRCAQGLGIALVRQQRLSEARSVLEGAVAAWPDRPEARTALAGTLFAAQAFSAAREQAARAAALDPTSVDAHVALVQVDLRLGRTDEARVALAAARLPGPEKACLELMIGLEEGASAGSTNLAYCRQATHPGLASTVDARLSASSGRLTATAATAAASGATTVERVARALHHHQQGRDDLALPLLDAALAQEPRRVDARILRALVAARRGQQDAALRDLDEVFAARSWVQVHTSGEMSGVLTKADEAALQDSVRQGAGLLVSLLVEAKRLDEADVALKRANEQLGMGPELSAGAVRLRLAQNRPADAWAVLENGLDRWPDHADLQLLLGECNGRAPELAPASLQARIQALSDWRGAYTLASAEARSGEHRACAERLGRVSAELLRQASAEDRLTVQRLWHTCAVNADWQSEAERAATAIGSPDALNEAARVEHARLRLESGDPTGARRLLAELKPSTEARAARVQAILEAADGG